MTRLTAPTSADAERARIERDKLRLAARTAPGPPPEICSACGDECKNGHTGYPDRNGNNAIFCHDCTDWDEFLSGAREHSAYLASLRHDRGDG